MRISTRVNYGMRLMFQLALQQGRGFVFLKDIAAREEISEKYLSQIVIPLRGANLVVSSRGAHGGYRLARGPAQISVCAIVEALDPDMVSSRRGRRGTARDQRPSSVTQIVWDAMNEVVKHQLQSMTLQTLLDAHRARMASAVEYHI